MYTRRAVLAAIAAFVTFVSIAAAAPFTAGNLVLYRVGDGSAALGSGGTAVFLDEYTPAGTLVQSVAMPTAASPRLVASGTATTEGFLTRSEDTRYLIVPGYDAALGTAVTASNTVPRVIGRVDANGNLDASTSYIDTATVTQNIRSATSVDGARFWTSGATQGPRTIVFGATTATVISTTNTNTRQINIFNDQLYIASGAGTVRMATIGTGLPTTSGQAMTSLPGFPTAAPAAFNGFFIVRLDGGTVPDTVYISDEGNNQVQKWCLNSGTWVQKGSVSVPTPRGLTASVSGTTVTLYMTSGGSGTPVLTVTDSTGFNGTLAGTAATLIAGAGTNKAFRAIALAPTGGTPVTPPSAPTGLTATAGNAHVALSWTASSGATSYNVKRATVSGGPYTTIATAITTTSYDDTTAANGTTYFYVVSAVNSGGESGNSAEVSATPVAPSTNPSGSGSANPSSVQAGNSTTLTVTVTPGTNPPSTGIAVRADLSSIGGSSTQAFTGNGGNSFSFVATVSNGTTAGAKTLPVTITDAQSRTGTTSIALTVTAASTPPTGVASANPGAVLPGASSTITVTVTPGNNPTSSGITVTGNFTAVGGSAAQSFTDNGGNSFSTLVTVASTASVGAKSLPITISDAQGRSSTTSASLTVLPPTTVKISQVYGGGGNSGSTYTNDFVELYNSGSTPVSLDGWSVQATSATATSWTANGAPTLLSGVIQPGHYYLVQESQGSGGTTPLPTPDAAGVITMSGTQAKVALVAGTAALSGACPSGLVDLVGYGGANCSEASPTPSLSNTTAAIRRNNGCVDTDNNLNDFLLGGPIPRNSASPVNSCGGDPSQPSASGLASPNALEPAGNALLTVTVTPASLPPSTNVGVVANLTSIGLAASQQFFDDGTHGDQTAGDNVFSYFATIDRLTSTGPKSMVSTVSDAQGRTTTAPITLTVVSPSCGVERWSVKVGVDPDAPSVDVNNPTPTTIANLRTFPAPADPPGPPDNARVFPWEGTVYTINGTLTLYKKETDVDYHIVVQDAQGNTVITEIPSPACIITSTTPRVPASSPFTSGINIARGKFDARYTPTSFFQSANVPVRITGVGFFDFIHGQTGVAPNGIELHPVLDITFTAPTTTALASSPNPSQFGGAVTITATVSGGTATPTGNVTFFDGGNSLASRALDGSGVATYVTSGLQVGSHSITASYEGDVASAPSTGAAIVQTVNKGDQTITFNALPNKVYGDAPFTVSAFGGGSTSPVTFAATGNCTSGGTNGSTITITGAGTCTVTASQLGDANFNAAADVSQTFAITQAAASISVTGYSGVYDGHPHGATGSAHGINGEDLTSLLDLGASFTNVPGGTAHWTFAGNANYAPASGDAAITITQATASITVNGYSGVYDGNAHGATGSAHGVNNEDLSNLLNLGASFTDVPGGTAHWTFAGNTNYAPASGDASITITQATASITVNGYSGVYDGNAHGATGSAAGVNGENLSALLNLGASFTNVPGGTAHWTFAGNTNYAPASGDATIAITQAAASVTVTGYSGVYDGHAHGATGSAHGVNNEDLSNLLNLGASFTDVPGGTAHWTFAGNTNYAPASADATIAITKANATIHVNGFTGAYDGNAHGATGSATGVLGENLSALLNLGASFTNVPGGTAHWTFAGNTNYQAASGDAAIVITQAAAHITVNGYGGVYDGNAHGATGSATGVNGENLSALLNLGASFTNVPGGSANWTFAGNTNYAPASGSVNIIINAALPVITVDALTFVYDGAPHAATASATGLGGVTVPGSFTFTYNGSPAAPVLPGTYAVVATFTSANTNYANTTGTGTLTITGLREDLAAQIPAIAALRDGTTNKQDVDRLNDAIKHLGEAVEPDLWRDSIHGSGEGDAIFTEGKNALIPLLAILKDSKTTIAASALQPIVNRIVADLRQLALTAINDAAARGANVDKARAELAKGDADIQSGQYESGIEHYRSAWNIAVKL